MDENCNAVMGEVRANGSMGAASLQAEKLAALGGNRVFPAADRSTVEKIQLELSYFLESYDAVSAVNLNGVLIFWNMGAEELYGWRASETLGRNILDYRAGRPDTTVCEPPAPGSLVSDTQSVEMHRLAFAVTLDEGRWKGELFEKTKSGKEICVLSRWTLMRDKNGKPQSIMISSTDIGEYKALEAKYRRAQRMETLGVHLSSIAHDLSNILGPMRYGVEILRKTGCNATLSEKILAMLKSSLEKGTGMVRDVLAFASGCEVERRYLDPTLIIEDMKNILEEIVPKTIKFSVVTDTVPSRIFADKTQIERVLMNLAVNARDAMPDGGNLTISSRRVTLGDHAVGGEHGARPGNYVLIQVSDTGYGISKENMDKLFRPFFTTKGSTKGTGLGLTIVHEVVVRHDGFIKVESEPETGTTFSIYLPEKS